MSKTYKFLLFIMLVLGYVIVANAQGESRVRRMYQYNRYVDSLITANNIKLGFIRKTTPTEESISPYMYRLSDPTTFYSNALKNHFAINWNQGNKEDSLLSSKGMLYRSSLNSLIDKALVFAYMYNPKNFQRYDAQFNNEEVLTESRIEKKNNELDIILTPSSMLGDMTSVFNIENVDIKAEKPNFWKKSGKFTTQFTQSYFSENWYKGGSNNVTLLATLLLEANYNDQKRVQWDNKADFRLGFVSTPADEYHKFITNNDKIYLSTKLGIKATKAWFYTIQGDVNSQFMSGYRTNKKETFSKFLSPLDVFVSVGMDFKPTLKKGTFSAALLPLSYKMRYIHSDDENNTIHSTYAMMKDGVPLTTKHDFGSKVELNAKFELVKNLTWRSRAYYYTTYKYVEAEWENALSFQFNKYLSTEVNALWRFDDNRAPSTKEGHKLGYFQFKEYFTFGIAYNF